MPEQLRNSSANILANARSVLSAAISIAPLVPVPIVTSIFMCAQSIIDEAEVGVQNNLLLVTNVSRREFERINNQLKNLRAILRK